MFCYYRLVLVESTLLIRRFRSNILSIHWVLLLCVFPTSFFLLSPLFKLFPTAENKLSWNLFGTPYQSNRAAKSSRMFRFAYTQGRVEWRANLNPTLDTILSSFINFSVASFYCNSFWSFFPSFEMKFQSNETELNGVGEEKKWETLLTVIQFRVNAILLGYRSRNRWKFCFLFNFDVLRIYGLKWIFFYFA